MKLLYFFILSFVWMGCNSNEKSTDVSKAGNPSISTVKEGEQLFKINCAQCHMPAKDFAAPALAGVEKRWTNKKLLYDFIRNSQEVIQKDKYAADLFEKWKQAPMIPFPDLTDRDIEAILEYCNQAGE